MAHYNNGEVQQLASVSNHFGSTRELCVFQRDLNVPTIAISVYVEVGFRLCANCYKVAELLTSRR